MKFFCNDALRFPALLGGEGSDSPSDDENFSVNPPSNIDEDKPFYHYIFI